MDAAVAPNEEGSWPSSYRLVPAAETLERVTPLLPAMGITRVANVTGLDDVGIPVVMVSRPNSRSISVSQGKGLTLEAAKVSGIMEAVESYHAERIENPLRLGSFEDLRYTNSLADVFALPRTADGTFAPYAQLLWAEGEDLFSAQPVLVPYELVHLDYSLPLPTGHGCFQASSNGLASGNHRTEAIGHAMCEVIERDASTLWHLRSGQEQAATRVDLDSVDDVQCRQLIEQFEEAEVELAVWDTTSDIQIPSFLCRALERKPPPYSALRPGCGMGCHVTRGLALVRALTEAAQSRLTFISGARDDMSRKGYERFLDPAVHEQWVKSMKHEGPRRAFSDVPDWNCSSPQEVVSLLLTRLGSLGFTQAVAVDLSKPHFGIPVVRVIVPGLEGVGHSQSYVPGQRAAAVLARTKP